MFSKKIKTIVSIEGMSCEHCAKKVESALKSLENVKSIKVFLSKKEAVITSEEKLDFNLIKDAIEELDYKVNDISEK